MIGRRSDEPVGNAGADGRRGQAELADCAEEAGDMLIENLLRGGGRLRVCPDINTAAMTPLGPAFPLQLAVTCAYGVGVDGKAAGQFTRAGQTVAGTQVAAENGQDDLGNELAIDGDFTAGGEPEPHKGPLDYSAIAAGASCDFCRG